MFNSYYLQKYAQMKHHEFLVEADQARLRRMFASDRPCFGQRLRCRVGNWLIVLGYKLKAQPPLILWEQGLEGKN